MNRLADWLAAGAHRHPERPALCLPHATLSHAELAAVARHAADRLQAALTGAGETPPIVAVAGTASELVIAALACSRLGLGLLPLDPQTADARWAALRAQGGIHLRRLPPPLPETAIAPPHAAASGDALATACGTAAPAIALVIATSGSEGTPKAVMLTPDNLDAAARASNARLPLGAGDLWLACLPLHHIGGISILYRCLRAGATLQLHAGFDAATVAAALTHQAVTHLSLVPAMLARLLDLDVRPPASLRHALIGGAALSRPLFERARAAGWPLCPSWGMSECAAQAATLVAPGDDWHEGAVGPLLDGLACRVDETGRLCLRGPQVMAGYLNPDLAPGHGLAADGWLRTADLGGIDARGHLRVHGRADDVFVSGGVNVHPLEVESCLAACPGVADVAVTALPDPVWGDALVALVVGNALPESVRDWGRRHLPPAQRPRRVLGVPRLPRNAMGKIERAALRALARDCREAS